MRILMAITSLGVGGAERMVTALADRYATDGHQVVLVRFHGEADLQPTNPRVRMENLDMPRSPLAVLAALGRFRRLIREFRPDVVNSHLVHANILTRLLRLVTPMSRLVRSAHNTNEEGRERLLVIHNGIDTQSFGFDASAQKSVREELRVDESTPLLLTVCRLWEQKDYSNLLHAFSRLDSGSVPSRLLIVGDGPLRRELEAVAGSLIKHQPDVGRNGADQMQGIGIGPGGPAPVVLAVDRHHHGGVQRGSKPTQPTAKSRFKQPRIDGREYAAEGSVRGKAVLKHQETAQQVDAHSGPGVGVRELGRAAQRHAHRYAEQFREIVPHLMCAARITGRNKHILQRHDLCFLHRRYTRRKSYAILVAVNSPSVSAWP